MKNLHFLVVAGCLVFSQAHAETAYRNAQTKSQAQGQYLSAFWKESQTSHAFVDAFSDPRTELVIGESESVHLVDGAANASSNMNQTLAVVQLQK